MIMLWLNRRCACILNGCFWLFRVLEHFGYLLNLGILLYTLQFISFASNIALIILYRSIMISSHYLYIESRSLSEIPIHFLKIGNLAIPDIQFQDNCIFSRHTCNDYTDSLQASNKLLSNMRHITSRPVLVKCQKHNVHWSVKSLDSIWVPLLKGVVFSSFDAFKLCKSA